MPLNQLDVQRIVFSPDIGPTPGASIAHYRISIGFSTVSEALSGSNFIAMLSDGAPENAEHAGAIYFTGQATVPVITARCTSGLADRDVRCGGLLILEGTLPQ